MTSVVAEHFTALRGELDLTKVVLNTPLGQFLNRVAQYNVQHNPFVRIQYVFDSTKRAMMLGAIET